MTTYNTHNALGSTVVKDLYDNAENLDRATNDRQSRDWLDRFGKNRRSWWGMEQDFQDFLISSGYQNIGDYGLGLEITTRNQVFWMGGELYRAGAVLSLPYTTTGDWAAEESLFVSVGDQALRQDLASSATGKGGSLVAFPGGGFVSDLVLASGASHVGFSQPGPDPIPRTVQDKLREQVSVKDYGAIGDGITDDTLAFQKALDFGGTILVPPGTYKVTSTLVIKSNSTKIRGATRDGSAILYTGAIGPVFESISKNTETLLWCEISQLKIAAESIASGNIIDWMSMQLGLLDELFLFGPSLPSTVAINSVAIWAETEATYNVIRNCYMGGVETGIRFGDGSNSNIVIGGRAQIPVPNGQAILAAATSFGKVSNITILGFGMEFPGTISNGINLTNVEGATINGCRFEELKLAIYIDNTCSDIQAPLRGNYFSGCVSKITALAKDVEPTILAQVSFDGTSGAPTGIPRGCSVSRTGVGAYTVTFSKPLASAEYCVALSGSADLKYVIYKDSSSFNIVTQTVGKNAIDPPFLDVIVSGVN